MSTPSLSMTIAAPLFWGSGSHIVAEETDFLQNYTHEIRAFGGFYSASFQLTKSLSEVTAWGNGLGRDVTIYNPNLGTVWNGFVNRVILMIGTRSFVRGPLLDVANRVSVEYAPLLPITYPPTKLQLETTAVANDTASQALWGIHEKVITAGERTDALAVQTRDQYLATHAQPWTTHQEGAAPTPTVLVECLGYVHWLFYTYTQTVNSDELDLSNPAGTGKLQLILAADPNAILSTDYTRTVANTLQVAAYEDQNRTAEAILKELTALGDAAYNRYLFGIYENQQAVYQAAPTDIDYFQHFTDAGEPILTEQDAVVDPWDVRPGRWLVYADLDVGAPLPAAPTHDDLRYEFIETVTYTAPHTVSHTGGRTDRINQILARKGLSGDYV